MSQSKLKINDLLEQIGTHEVHGNPRHRYELRRALLCSRYFGDEFCSPKISRWDMIFTYTAPLIAGSVTVGVFAFMATSFTGVQGHPFQEISGDIELAIQSPDFVDEGTSITHSFIPVTDFVSNPNEPLVQLADFNNERRSSIQFIPVSPRMAQ
jgi:hypothetical protein